MSTKSADVLIVDDDMDIRMMIQAVLHYHGYLTEVCSSPDQMYQLLEVSHPKLILMDMLLSGSDGREICKHLKNMETTKDIPILMISAHPDAGSDCKSAGADEFLEKPFEIDTLARKVNGILRAGPKRASG